MRTIIFILSLLFCTVAFAQNKIALIVAVGEYPANGRWKNLSSENDVKYVKAALLKNGYRLPDIDTLINQNATKKNILTALDALYQKAKSGDIVVFHFSGHGQQIEDDNGDEADGYDEAIIPYDAKGLYNPVSYTGQNHLRDDELKEKLSKIRSRLGSTGSLVIIIDACHSGTATRGNEFAICRGEPTPFQSPEYEPKKSLSVNNLAADGFAESGSGSNMIVFSASSPNQVNYETKDADNAGVGSLSYAFAKAVNDLPSNSNYYLLFQKIKAQIQANYPTQIPMIEGDITQQVFSGAYTKRNEIIPVSQWLNDSTFLINTGSLENVRKGSTFKVYSLNSKEAVAEGRVIQVNLFQSAAVVKKQLDKSLAYEIKWDAMSQGSFSASLFINAHNTTNKQLLTVQKQLTDFIKAYPFLSISNNADYMLDIKAAANGNTEIAMLERGDSTRLSLELPKGASITEEHKKQLLNGIKTAMRVKYLRSLNDGGSVVEGVKVELIPKKNSPAGNEIFLNPLDEFSIRITNNSPHRLYYTIIDIMPNNEAKVLIPEETATPQDYVLAAGQSFSIDDIRVDEGTPRGKEFFKLIFSKSPLDLRSIFEGTKTRAQSQMLSFEHALEDMFQDANDKSTTRSSIGSVKVDEVGIITTGFTVANSK